MSLLEHTLASIVSVDEGAGRAAQVVLDAKTKPRRSLGRLEDLVCQLAAIQRSPAPSIRGKAIVVMAADHGVAEEGVSAYPAEVTGQMLLNFSRGGAAINVLARQVGARVVVADMGVRQPPPALPGVRSLRIGPGTANFTRGPAMTETQARTALESGIALMDGLADEGVGLVGLGDMGIGNTTSASALTAALTGLPPEEVTGRGTGVDEAGLARKLTAIRRALTANPPDRTRPLAILAGLGGFEIAGLAGVTLGAAARRVAVVIDGFIASTAALLAARLCPRVRPYLLPSHRSVEPGHGTVLRELGLRPLLDLDCRLGEGTGAACVMSLIDAALAILEEMATFDSAGVSDTGR